MRIQIAKVTLNSFLSFKFNLFSILLSVLFFLSFNSSSFASSDEDLRITTMNIAWYGSTMFPPMNDIEREDYLKDFFASDLIDSDIILFQEITKPEQFLNLLNTKYSCAAYDDRGRSHQYVLTCFNSQRFEIVGSSQNLFDPTRALIISEPKERLRDVNFLKLKEIKTGKIYNTFNLHLKSGLNEDEIREVQVNRLFENLKKLNLPSQESIVIGGDFNSYVQWIKSVGKNEIENALKIGAKQGFKLFTVKGLYTTLSQKQKSFDYLLLETPYTVQDYFVHPVCSKPANPPSLVLDYTFFKDNISDHCPVTTVLKKK